MLDRLRGGRQHRLTQSGLEFARSVSSRVDGFEMQERKQCIYFRSLASPHNLTIHSTNTYPLGFLDKLDKLNKLSLQHVE
jgi:gamma-glutamyl:cysteine ligase YbdK (ATP-grasp superfamily)